jgi:hypothetical protein
MRYERARGATYDDGFKEGFAAGWQAHIVQTQGVEGLPPAGSYDWYEKTQPKKRKRKLSDWQKYVKVNSKKPRFKYKSGSKRGRVNFKALGIAFRKTPAGKKKRR